MAEPAAATPDLVARLCAAVRPADPRSVRLSKVRQRALARPDGSLGQLDHLVHRIAGIRHTGAPTPMAAVVGILAADHGVAVHGTSSFDPSVTSRVAALIAAGRAPVNVLAARVPARVEFADFGLSRPVGDPRYRVAPGTRDISRQDAMSVGQALHAIGNGADFASERLSDGPLVAVGEIGVGNTTATAALAARLLDAASRELVGPGSGVDSGGLARKRALVDQALRRVRRLPDDPLRLLAALGGFEIAGNVGVILAAAADRRVIVLDGFITAVAALVAVRLCPTVNGYLVAAHRSSEPGHRLLLDALGHAPLLSLGMRLGMGSGAALALGLVNSALAVASLTPSASAAGLTVDARPGPRQVAASGRPATASGHRSDG